MASASRERLVADYPYFCRAAHRIAGKLPAEFHDEAQSEALVSMVDAADDFVQNGVTFRQFVTWRIEQRMIDQFRKHTAFSRKTGESRLGRSLDEPTIDGQTLADLLVSKEISPPERAEMSERLATLETLPMRWRMAMTLDTSDAMEQLDVSESRISQLRKEAQAVLARETHPIVIVTVPPLEIREARAVAPSDRELEVLHLIAIGDTNVEAGKTLHVSPETVKTHIKHVIRKLVARNRTHAVSIAWEQNWWAP